MADALSDIRVVLFDVGGVLVTNRPDPVNIARILGLDLTEADVVHLVDQAVWVNRDAYDEGAMTDREFWDTVAGDCGLPETSEDVLRELVRADTERLETPEPRALAIARELHAAGLRLGILSNAPVPIARTIMDSPWALGLFTTFSFSGDLHANKPAQAIYRHAIDAAQEPAKHILFLDDRRPNLRGAELAGMRILQWDSPDQARRDLIKAGLLGRVVAG